MGLQAGVGKGVKQGLMTEEAAPCGPSIEMPEILKRIPHRFPFLLIDRAENYQPHKSIVGIKCVTMNEPFFQGHFPQNPVMPGVLIVEALGQTGAVLMSKSLDADIQGRTILFISVDNCRFRAPVKPGDVLRMQVDVLRHRSDLFKFQGRAFVDGKVAAQADFAAMVVSTS